MTLSETLQIRIDGNYHIIFDPERVEAPSADLFNPDLLKRQGVLEGTAGGRGTSCIVRLPDSAWVLRHYRRGGLLGKVLHDQYCGSDREKSRSWREWRLLHLLHREGFPVPRPIAAAFVPCFLSYRADLITEFITGTQTLAEKLSAQELDRETWRDIGATVARFHERGVCHADLNAHNILIDAERTVHLIDFDKGEILPPGRWRRRNIDRLQRSLHKLKGERETFFFDGDAWRALLDGYDRSRVTSL